jgi:hypothetical protein
VERLGIPTAPVITQRFEELVKTIAYKKGMPNQRLVFVPHPVAGRPPELCRRYMEGNDPVTKKPIVEELFAALTKPLTLEEKKTGFLERPPRPRLLAPDTAENLQRLFAKNGWTDGIPVVIPTEERVALMLKNTSHKPDEVVGTMRPSPPHEAWEFTVEMVATNAVMAGAKPEYLPVILALASTGVTSLFSSTTSFARMVVINGPIREQINMNSGIGAMGPFNEANATIGRAWTLISKNLGGGGTPGETYLGSQGNNLNYNNICFAEKEEALPAGWNPLHVQKGHKAGESYVSTLTGWSIINYGGFALPHHQFIKRMLTGLLGSGTGSGSQATLLLDPIAARDLRNDEGFDTKEKLSEWLMKNGTSPAQQYWTRHADELKKGKEGIEPFASWLKYPEDAFLPVSNFRPETPIEIIVVGGETNAFLMAGDFRYVSGASVDNWR